MKSEQRRDQQLITAVDNRGKGDIADSIGMPDEKDYAVLHGIIQKFEAKYPGLLKATTEAGRRDSKGFAKKNSLTYAFELPAPLYYQIEKVFPSMFRSKKHLRWFRRNFHKLTIGDDPKL